MRDAAARVGRHASALSREALLCQRIVMARWRVDYLGKKGDRLGIVEARDQSEAIDRAAEVSSGRAPISAWRARNPESQEMNGDPCTYTAP